MRLWQVAILAFVLTGCSMVRSSYHFTKGTEAINNGCYDEAIDHLEQAVALDPSMARNHTNLAASYAAKGETMKAWFSVRQAVLAPYPDYACNHLFFQYFNQLVKTPGLDRPGTSQQDIENALGKPDVIGEVDSYTLYQYGVVVFRFKEGKLVTVSR